MKRKTPNVKEKSSKNLKVEHEKSLNDLLESHQALYQRVLNSKGSLTPFDKKGALTTEKLAVICEAVKKNNVLKELDLRECELRIDGAKSLSECLKINTSLSKLRLLHCLIYDGMQNVCDGLSENQFLKIIELPRSLLTENEIKIFSEHLKENNSLTELNLKNNMLGVDGLSILCENLKQNTTLKKLDLSMNTIHDKGIKELSEYLKENKSLNEIILSANKIQDYGIEILSDALIQNSSLQKIDLSTILGFERKRKSFCYKQFFLKIYLIVSPFSFFLAVILFLLILGSIIQFELQIPIQRWRCTGCIFFFCELKDFVLQHIS